MSDEKLKAVNESLGKLGEACRKISEVVEPLKENDALSVDEIQKVKNAVREIEVASHAFTVSYGAPEKAGNDTFTDEVDARINAKKGGLTDVGETGLHDDKKPE